MATRIACALSVLVAWPFVIATSIALGAPVSTANATPFGPSVYVFDPSMPAADIQKTAGDIFTTMEANQFGAQRYALLFKPGTYDVNFFVGFYTLPVHNPLRTISLFDDCRK